MQATQDDPIVETPGQADATPWLRIAIWTALFQFAWFWEKLPNLLLQGALPDTDDYQRLHSVRALLDGQGWFDLTNYRMDPPGGADMHWSRLVDAPIAALVSFFDLFMDQALAERVTAILWPLALMIATVFVILAVCRRLEPSANPLLALFFSITCITALTEFMPGRLDHHSVQILGFCLMLLGLTARATAWGPFLVGAAAAFSISVGLDAILMVVFMLGWLGLEWAIGLDRHGRAITRAGIGLATSTPLLYAANIGPDHWLSAHCDANSIVYFSTTMAIAAGLVMLGLLSASISSANQRQMIALRLGAGGLTAAAIVTALLVVFPHCTGGPYGSVSSELASRWLVNVSEARGLLTQLEHFPQMWFWALGYSLVVLVAGFVVVSRRGAVQPAFLAIYATFAISVLASLIQYRAMRIGVFASIPLIVVFVGMAWDWTVGAFANRKIIRAVSQVAVVALLAQPVWLGVSLVVLPADRAIAAKGISADARNARATQAPAQWRNDNPELLCNLQSQYALLSELPRGLVMSDINSGPAIVAHTSHDVVGGPYHRNERAILDMVDFFETDETTARQIAEQRGPAYVAFCEPVEGVEHGFEDHPALAVRIQLGNEPAWMERLSSPADRLHLFRLNLN